MSNNNCINIFFKRIQRAFLGGGVNFEESTNGAINGDWWSTSEEENCPRYVVHFFLSTKVHVTKIGSGRFKLKERSYCRATACWTFYKKIQKKNQKRKEKKGKWTKSRDRYTQLLDCQCFGAQWSKTYELFWSPCQSVWSFVRYAIVILISIFVKWLVKSVWQGAIPFSKYRICTSQGQLMHWESWHFVVQKF